MQLSICNKQIPESRLSNKIRSNIFLSVICCLQLACFNSCEEFMAPFSPFVANAIGIVMGLETTISTDHYPNDLRSIPVSNYPDRVTYIPVNEITEVIVAIRNTQKYELELVLSGEGESIASVAASDDRQFLIVTIANPGRLDNIDLTIAIFENGRPMPDCKLPVMQGRFFNADLISLSVTSDYEESSGSFDRRFSPEVTGYSIYVPYESTKIHIAASVMPDVFSSFAINGTEIVGMNDIVREGGIDIHIPDVTTNIQIIVTADCTDTKTYTLEVTRGLSPYAYITMFGIDVNGVTFSGIIDDDARTIHVTLPYGADVTNKTPTIEYEGSSVSPATAQNFTSPVIYTVTSPQGNTKDYTVNVTHAGIDSIEITSPPYKTDYYTGDTEIDTAGLVVTVVFDNGATSVITGFELSGFDTGTPGEKIITVSYDGKSASFTVTVNEGSGGNNMDIIFNITLADLEKGANPEIEAGTISRKEDESLTITLPDGFSSPHWFINGPFTIEETSITVNALDYAVGDHSIHLIVEDADGKWYSATVTFNVNN